MGNQREKLLQTITELRGRGETFAEIGSKVDLSEEQVRGLFRRHVARRTEAPAPALEKPEKTPEGVGPPEVRLDGYEGYIATGPVEVGTPDFDELLRHFGFDPQLFEIVEPVNVRTWDAAIGDGKVRRMWYHRANVRRRLGRLDPAHVVELEQLALTASENPVCRWAGEEGLSTFVVAIGDPQVGKSDGDGLEGLIRRFNESIAKAELRLAELRSMDRKVGTIALINGGDVIENTDGHYAMQAFSAALDRRSQERVSRNLWFNAVHQMSRQTSDLLVAGVPGNHPENRRDGKAYTSFGDNFDLALLEQLREITAVNPDAYGHVRYEIPDDEMEVVLDLTGTKLGIAHGHQIRGSGTIEKRTQTWWEEQMLGRQPIGEADILLTFHNHHLIVKDINGRTWMQAPALESRSDWFRHTHGSPGNPAILTFVTSGGKWSDLEVLR